MAVPVTRVLARAEAISKSFGPVQALDKVDLELRAGLVHAVVGHNGAGKSTLMNILSGVVRPDSGRLIINDDVVQLNGPRDAFVRGIAMVHQELSVIPDLDVAENLLIGREPLFASGLVRRGELNRRAEQLLADLGLDFPVRTLCADLPIGSRQMIEIARAISIEATAEARILILDEPTSALTVTEQRKLFEFVRRLTKRGVGILYVSHRLAEVLELADEVTVLRDGRLVATKPAKGLDQASLVEMMVGHELAEESAPADTQTEGERGLEVSGLNTLDGRLHDIAFKARRGEILGIAGMLGSGRSTLLGSLFGIVPIASGLVRINGSEIKPRSPRAAMAQGICLVPGDRRQQGIFPGLSLWKNVALAAIHDLFRGLLWTVKARRARQVTQREVDRLGIATPTINKEIQFLSGGSQQKVILARWLNRQPRVLLLDEPTAGIDVGAVADVHRIVRELAAGGTAVIVSSSEFSELLGLCHRILVLRHGTIVAQILPATTTEAGLVRLATEAVAAC